MMAILLSVTLLTISSAAFQIIRLCIVQSIADTFGPVMAEKIVPTKAVVATKTPLEEAPLGNAAKLMVRQQLAELNAVEAYTRALEAPLLGNVAFGMTTNRIRVASEKKRRSFKFIVRKELAELNAVQAYTRALEAPLLGNVAFGMTTNRIRPVNSTHHLSSSVKRRQLKAYQKSIWRAKKCGRVIPLKR